MNTIELPTNHRLVTPEELATQPLPQGYKYKWKDANEWKRGWMAGTYASKRDIETMDFCAPIPAVPAAEEKGLLPCPFCGSAATMEEQQEGIAIGCSQPCLPAPLIATTRPRNEAIAAWNRRPTPAIQQAVEALSFPELLKEAQKQVKESVIYRKFIDGTPLENDIPVWMAMFAVESLLRHLNGEVRG
jgi:hypothetical protein